MPRLTTSAFALPDHLAPKSDPALIAADEEHFTAIALSLEHSLAVLSPRLAVQRKAPSESSTESLERDQDVHRLTARLRLLRQAVPTPVRAASARALALARPDAALVALFAEDELSAAAPVLRTAARAPFGAAALALIPAPGRRARRSAPGSTWRGGRRPCGRALPCLRAAR